MIMNKRFIRRITQLNKSLLGLSWVGFANLGASPQTPLFNQKEQGYNLLKWCPVKWGNRTLTLIITNYYAAHTDGDIERTIEMADNCFKKL